MTETSKEVKRRYFQRKYDAASEAPCACGCGAVIKTVDMYGRPKKFVSGHNTPRKYFDPGQYKREWNHRNRVSRQEYKKRYHLKRRTALLQLFGGTCADCGIKYNCRNGSIFHFHHLDPSTKSFNVGNQVTVKSWAKLVEECKKCVLICANCHELRHSPPY